MSHTPSDDEGLREELWRDYLVHDEECAYSLYDSKCNCIQLDVTKNLAALIFKLNKSAVQDTLETLRRNLVGDLFGHDYLLLANEIENRISDLTTKQDTKEK